MRRKRRKKLAKAWKEFQDEHELSDADLKLARSAGYPLDRLLKELATEAFCEYPIRQAISLIHSQHEQMLAQRRAEIASGGRVPKVKKKIKKDSKFDPEWVKAKKLCRLNQDDIRKAKELGFKPKSLIKNIPSPNQRWKRSVKDWIGELYEKRFPSNATRSRKTMPSDSQRNDGQSQFGYATAFDAYLAGDFAALHALECQRESVASETWRNGSDLDDIEEIPF